ncbi:hypothetical protein [Demequina litorisediminis]|uniref:Uncharacterized protein n=1 Tax=Demequina litorisediminis TaxID=1849022 RepID=A0ABQ6IGR3_9MICO|nr:hypothetical protein [Demequina litorisediminis]GMA36934.1 hypothetical protein GCM10025876_31380 [Demequina litorisediminis]
MDLVLLATGYRHTLPYAQALFGDEQHPDMYLTAFARTPGLYGIGFVETNSGAYILMDMLSQMVAQHIADRMRRPGAWEAFEKHVANDRPDLSGGIRFVDSPRHTGYVDSPTIRKYLKSVSKRMGWTLRSLGAASLIEGQSSHPHEPEGVCACQHVEHTP